MSNHVGSVFVKLTVVSMLVFTVGATGCSSGGSVKTDSATTRTTGGTTGGSTGTVNVTPEGSNTSVSQDGAVTDGEIIASPDAFLCVYAFEQALTEAMGLDGWCNLTSSLPDGGVDFGPSGEIVFDSEGQVIEVTRNGVSGQPVMDSLPNEIWPCLAGETVQYSCEVGG
jgi:hypothetical protein